MTKDSSNFCKTKGQHHIHGSTEQLMADSFSVINDLQHGFQYKSENLFIMSTANRLKGRCENK